MRQVGCHSCSNWVILRPDFDCIQMMTQRFGETDKCAIVKERRLNSQIPER